MEADDVLRAQRERAVEHCLDLRVGDRRALSVGERVDVEDQRLLDLGVVEQVAVTARRDLRMVGEHDRGAEDRVVAITRQHRPGVDALAPAAERRHEPAALHPEHDVQRDQRALERAAAVEPRRDLRRVVHAAANHAGVVGFGSEREARTGALDGGPLAIRDRPELEPLLGPIRGQPPDRGGKARTALGDAFEPGVVVGAVALRRVRRRVHDPERRRASRSWSRPGCTGRARSPRTAACRPAHRASSSSSTHASKLGRPRAARLALSASSVSCESRIQPPPG